MRFLSNNPLKNKALQNLNLGLSNKRIQKVYLFEIILVNAI
jgi:hypothetical protein